MSYSFQLKQYYTVKERKEYPWPCRPEPDRMVELHPGDVLSRMGNGTMTKLSGLGMCGIRVPEDDLVLIEHSITLVVGPLLQHDALLV
ncbi:MAG: hypothetical protein AB1513_05810 [Pseudomonadota bacterium]